MDRKVPKYFINIMLSWFEKGCAYVRWGSATSFVFAISAGVRQGDLAVIAETEEELIRDYMSGKIMRRVKA